MKRFLKIGLGLASSASVAACGVIYTPQVLPKLPKSKTAATAPEMKIHMVELTTSVAAQANRTPFPRLVVFGGDTSGAARMITVSQALNERLPAKGKPPAYEIGVGDVLTLARLIMPTGQSATPPVYTHALPVTSDGYVSILGVGRVPVKGLTTAGAEKAISAALLRAGQDPRIELAITGFNSQTVTVSGELSPGSTTTRAGLSIPYTDRPVRLSEVLTRAGLELHEGEDKLVRILRNGQEYRVSARMIMTTAAGQDYYVRGDDSIFVKTLTYRPERVIVAGEIGAPQLYPITQEKRQTLLDALYAAGGPSPTTGDTSEIYLLRRHGNDVTAYHLNASDPVRLTTAGRMELRPDDVVFVSAQPVTNFNRVIQQIFSSAPAIAQTSTGVRSALGN